MVQLNIVHCQTALEQIDEQVKHLLQQFKPSELTIVVGESAAMAICAQMHDKQLPHLINGVGVKRTGKFKGWEVIANGREVE